MLARLKKYSGLIVLGMAAVLAWFWLATPAYAVIAAPDSITINAVYCYQHCAETDDQLYIIDYTVEYTVNPDENVTEAYLIRLMNGAVELGSTAPYAYYDEGYARGIASIYFSADDAPTWNGSYTMKLEGNPTLDWGGTPPSTSVGTFDLWSSSTSLGATSAEVGARVLYFADMLELDWSVDMIETSGYGSWLTSYGEDYFTNSIPYLQLISPQVFSGSVVNPSYPDREPPPPTYATTLRTNIVGTPLDLSPTAAIVGIDTIWFTTAIFVGIMAVVAWGIAKKVGSVKPAFIVMAGMVPIGVLIGWLDLVVAILMGFASAVAIGYAFFLQKSSA